MITSASLRINILCINFKIRTRLFYSTTLLTHVGIGFCKKKPLTGPHNITKRECLCIKTSLTPLLFIEMPVPSQENEWSRTLYVC